jgi:hypothetical protein
MLNLTCRLTMLAGVMLFASAYVVAANQDRFQSNHDIRVEASDKANDVTCLNCSIYVSGEVNGDVTAIDGNVILENGGQVHGDTTSIFGDVRLGANTSADRDVTAVVGSVQRDSQAAVKGDVTALEGEGWIFLVVIFPLALLGGTIALVVWLIFWLVRRNSQNVPLAA